MARDKAFEYRMQGMIYACKLAKENGIDYLIKDIKRRGVIRADITYTDKQVNELWNVIGENINNNVLITTLTVLHNKFGFGKDRLNRFKDFYEKAIDNIIDLDYMGEHYVTLEDYAVELNEKYKMGLDVERASVCTEVMDKKNPYYKSEKFIDGVINSLKLAGYADAALFLEEKKKLDGSSGV